LEDSLSLNVLLLMTREEVFTRQFKSAGTLFAKRGFYAKHLENMQMANEFRDAHHSELN